MSRYVTVRLTDLEARVVHYVLRYGMEYPVCAEVFGETVDHDVEDKRRYRAAERVLVKVDRALNRGSARAHGEGSR